MWTTLPRRTRRNLKTTCLAVLAATARFTKARQAMSPVDALCLPARTWRPRAGARPGPKRAERSKDVDVEAYSPPPCGRSVDRAVTRPFVGHALVKLKSASFIKCSSASTRPKARSNSPNHGNFKFPQAAAHHPVQQVSLCKSEN